MTSPLEAAIISKLLQRQLRNESYFFTSSLPQRQRHQEKSIFWWHHLS